LKKPVILVPSPNVSQDHQTKNALALSAKYVSIMIADTESKQNLIPTALQLIKDDAKSHCRRNYQTYK